MDLTVVLGSIVFGVIFLAFFYKLGNKHLARKGYIRSAICRGCSVIIANALFIVINSERILHEYYFEIIAIVSAVVMLISSGYILKPHNRNNFSYFIVLLLATALFVYAIDTLQIF